VRSTPALAAFACAAIATQVLIGYDMTGSVWAAPTFPLINFGFASLVLWVVHHRPSPPQPTLRAPGVQLIIVLVGVAILVAGLSAQFPDPTWAQNGLTRAIQRAMSPVPGVLTNVAFACLPVVALLTLSRRLDDYGLARFDARSLLIIMALYLPLAIFSVQGTLLTAAVYFIVAAFPEELLFRALLQRRLRAVMRDPLIAVVVAALIFGFMHLPIQTRTHDSLEWAVVYCIGLNAFGGALFGYIYLRTQSLMVVAIIHLWASVATGATG